MPKKYIQYLILITIISVLLVNVCSAEDVIAKNQSTPSNEVLLRYVLSDILIRPNLTKGELDGIIVDVTSIGSFFYQIGLRKYDIIYEINDKKVSSLDHFMWLTDLILTSSLKKIKIKRWDQIEIINVDSDHLKNLLTADLNNTEPKLSVDFNNVNIQLIIRELSAALNKDFLIDPKVKGKATLTISKTVPLSKWHNIFSEFLDLYGYKIIDKGEISKIVPKHTVSRIQLKRSQIDDDMSTIDEFTKQVAIRPHFKDGKQDGIMLSNIKSNSIFRKMGLRNGDIIMGMNGEDIKTLDDMMKLYENLKSSSNVTLQIKRRSQSNNIEFNIQ